MISKAITKIVQSGKTTCIFISLVLIATAFLAIPLSSAQELTDSSKRKTEIFFAFDARNSFVASKDVRIGGFKIGLELRDRYRFGLGVYSMDPPIFAPVLKNKGKSNEEFFIYRIEFSYLGLFAEYVLFSNRKWEFSTPVVYGLGETRLFRSKDRNAKEWDYRGKMPVNLIEASIVGHYKIVYWIGIGGGFGYRIAITEEQYLKQSFDAPIYIIKIKLFIGDIYRRWKKK